MGCGWRANVLDLLGTVLTERLDTTPPDPDRAHRALMLQITSFIEEHLGEADLAPAQIAAAHHISLRQLHKLFHASGTTVAGWIRQRRLERCGHDLRDPRWSGRPVAAIGARWGYPDPAHFSRLFKAAYGVGPRDYRASVRFRSLRTLAVKRRALACKTGGGRPREHERHEAAQ
jgi:AraC-like DNA-binding protein